jgi:hypothetical protein
MRGGNAVNIDSNTRVIGGNTLYRRFAYLHKRDSNRFGLLHASGYKDAQRHLGSSYYIRTTWLTLEESHDQMFNRRRRWEIVSSIFLSPLSAAYIGRRSPSFQQPPTPTDLDL